MNPEPNPGLERGRFQLRASGIRTQTPNPLRSGIHTRGYLPHVKREGAWYFVTFRLEDSLPKHVLGEAQSEDRDEINREYQRKIERYLDLGSGACYLRRPEVARVAAEALSHFNGRQYQLDEWVIMPNHVHLLIWPMPNQTLSDILRSRKRRMGREANKILGRTGEVFWQHESYDHWIRNDEEKARVKRYIRNNPVSAKLCRTAEEWPWGSAFNGADCQSAIQPTTSRRYDG
jgi:REP element-mobilizing transposase RayT